MVQLRLCVKICMQTMLTFCTAPVQSRLQQSAPQPPPAPHQASPAALPPIGRRPVSESIINYVTAAQHARTACNAAFHIVSYVLIPPNVMFDWSHPCAVGALRVTAFPRKRPFCQAKGWAIKRNDPTAA